MGSEMCIRDRFMDDEENPYAFVVVAEKGNSGSQTAGPMANKVLQAIVKGTD